MSVSGLSQLLSCSRLSSSYNWTLPGRPEQNKQKAN